MKMTSIRSFLEFLADFFFLSITIIHKRLIKVLGFTAAFLFFLCISQGYSQEHSFQFKHLGLDEGLSQSSVPSIIQDDEGFMWFGTTGGLNRYDGHEMTVYRRDLVDNNSLSDKHIADMCKDTEGNLWIATGNGLSFFNIGEERFKRYFAEDRPGSVSANVIHATHCDTDGTVWVATKNGLNKLVDKDEGGFVRLAVVDGENNFQEVYRDSTGRLWAGTFGEGLYYLDREGQLAHSQITGLNNKKITTIHDGEAGYLWVGTNNGLYRINPERNKATLYQYEADNPASLSENTVNVVYRDSQSNVWVGTGDGLNLYHPETDEFTRFKADPRDDQSISSNQIHSLFEDRHNTLWIGTWSAGLNKFSYHQKDIQYYFHDPESGNSLSGNNIWDFLQDNDGQNIWIGTDEGLNRFNRDTGKFEYFLNEPGDDHSLSSNRIFNIAQDRSGDLWLATSRGVNKLNPESGDVDRYLHKANDPNTISYNSLWSLAIDSSGCIWIATTSRGLDVMDPETETFTHYRHDSDDPKSISSSFVTEIYIDSKSNIWVGTRQGLNLYQPERDNFKQFAYTAGNPHSLGNSSVLDIHEDSKGRLWVGTTMGANVLDIESHNVLHYFSRKNGLPDDIVYAITEDHEASVYLGTTRGLAVWNSETETFSIFDKRDGLQGNEFNAGAALTSSAGKVYMGGTNGFNTFFPGDLTGNPNVPPVVITDFQLFNTSVPVHGNREEKGENRDILEQSITHTDTLTLSYSDNVISFEFAALNFTIPEKNQYAYKLEGFDETWNYIGNRNFVTYTHLDPGEYTFRVKAANNDGVWNEEGTSLALMITPPFWQTSWFYLLGILLAGGTVVLGYRWKLRSIHQQNEQLEQEVESRTSELYEKNKHLKEALKELRETRSQLVEKAHKAGMADIATGVLHNVGNILNSVNTSVSMIRETSKKSKLANLYEANNLLEKHMDQIEEFILETPKGKKLLSYYLKLEEPLRKEQKEILDQSRRLNKKIDLISDVITAQQNYAGSAMEADQMSLEEMIDDALSLQSATIERHKLTVRKEINSVDPIIAHRTQLIHILINIFKNAKEAIIKKAPPEKMISIKVWQQQDEVFLSVSDNGGGIKEENMDKIFTQGFTTKKSGHGFGLHSCANYMRSMGGQIKVESEEEGATFTLIFPTTYKKRLNQSETLRAFQHEN
ncbi:Two component regulator propeller [Fodinibius roseus]|uniref:histidine kinase n=1 Tax=Fodinibius roseus TaxID=1194090 RepID=A0A1M5DIC1_9BACT|nr:two-component regulator propeller domain-containing protein [Fodinibius roseus]SHF66594.1 Two component regulator propeller [Fodinibius roseus]